MNKTPHLPYRSLVLMNSFRINDCRLIPKRFVATAQQTQRKIPEDGLTLSDFIKPRRQRLPKIQPTVKESDTYLTSEDLSGQGRTVKYVTYGCQMNVNDMEVVRSILQTNDYVETENLETADIVVLMTCSIREGAEEKVKRELKRIKTVAKRSQTVGVLGCMAERLRHNLLTKKGLVDVVAGPDSYRDLPRLLAITRAGVDAINVQLSIDETYADVAPVRVDRSAKSAFVSITRGCDNMCTYCIVPLTRGRERSRPIDSVLEEVRRLRDEGVRQITLLGQNVNSYRDMSESSYVSQNLIDTTTVPGFKTIYKQKTGGRTFATLLEKVSEIDSEIRIRFTSPHPKDFPIEVIKLIRDRPNICNQLHMPAQSGSNKMLDKMGRGYTRELYLSLIEDVRSILPDVAITSDFIAGFCDETEDDHLSTLDLIRRVKYSTCYTFPYSMRERTRAHYHLVDNVPEDVKRRRHEELARVFREEALQLNSQLINSEQLVLVEGISKRSTSDLQGRADNGTKVVFENTGNYIPGDYVTVKVNSCSSQTLLATALHKSSIDRFYSSL